MKVKMGDFAVFYMDKTKLNADIILKGVEAVDKRHGALIEGDFDRTVSPWDSKPTFKYAVTRKGNDLILKVGLTQWVDTGRHGGTKNEWKWVWLTKGTKKRWSVLSKDWRSKTMPKVITSRGGQGKVLAKGMAAVYPRKGIKARMWVPEIEAKRLPQLIEDTKKSLKWASLRIWQ